MASLSSSPSSLLSAEPLPLDPLVPLLSTSRNRNVTFSLHCLENLEAIFSGSKSHCLLYEVLLLPLSLAFTRPWSWHPYL